MSRGHGSLVGIPEPLEKMDFHNRFMVFMAKNLIYRNAIGHDTFINPRYLS
jgi:hypothetical protein